ncbi:MAG: rhodanese-like domain-containing protein [Bacteroidia bacterium]
MKKLVLFALPLALLLFAFGTDPIAREHQIQPQELNYLLINPAITVKPVIINVGTTDDQIKGSFKAGPVNDPKGMEVFKSKVAGIAKDKDIVVYCGCCSSANCPNIHPALDYLSQNGYTKVKVLNLAVGIKENWVSLGFPMEK